MDTATKVDTNPPQSTVQKEIFHFGNDTVEVWVEEITQTENPLRKYTITSTHPQRDNGPSEIFLRNKREIHNSVPETH